MKYLRKLGTVIGMIVMIVFCGMAAMVTVGFVIDRISITIEEGSQ